LSAFLDDREIECPAGGVRQFHHQPERVVLVIRQRSALPIDLVDALGDDLAAFTLDRLVELARLDGDRPTGLHLRLHGGKPLRNFDPQGHGRRAVAAMRHGKGAEEIGAGGGAGGADGDMRVGAAGGKGQYRKGRQSECAVHDLFPHLPCHWCLLKHHIAVPFVAPAFCVATVTCSVPAFSNVRVMGKLRPSFSGRFNPINITCMPLGTSDTVLFALTSIAESGRIFMMPLSFISMCNCARSATGVATATRRSSALPVFLMVM